jgi:hypothetical protein
MMKSRLLLKKTWMMLSVMLCTVFTAQAANITYSLTTHVDGRTITGVASVAEGASLQDNMPQDLWRGYTTYKYYSDEALTQEITTAPAEDATVYVDYEFDPPFQMSNDNKTVWNYLRNYNGGGSSHRYVYYQKSDGRIYSQKNTPNNSSTNDFYQWAFYGDGYDFQIKSVYGADNWLVWSGTNARIGLGAKPELGWQIYANAATNNKRPGGTVSLGIPETTSLVYLYDLGIAMTTKEITSEHKFDSHNQLVATHTGSGSQATMERNDLWWYAFFASPTSSAPATPDIWHVTYKIQKADGTWYDDIVIQKNSSNLTPSFPPAGFTPVEGYEYAYFYTDASFEEKYAEDYTMPNDRNTTLYIQEIASEPEPEVIIERTLQKDRWITLVLPYDVQDVNDIDGIKGEALEYKALTVEKYENAYWMNATLGFETVTSMEANKPYLFRAVEFPDGVESGRLAVYSGSEADQPTDADIQHIAFVDNNVKVEMAGTFEGKTLDVAPFVDPYGYEYIYFYFGYNPQAQVPYNFYVVDEGTVKINPSLCYFTATYVGPKDDASGAKGISLSFSQDVTGINSVKNVAEKNDGKVYNLNGQQVSGSLSKGIYIVNGKKVLVK